MILIKKNHYFNLKNNNFLIRFIFIISERNEIEQLYNICEIEFLPL